LDKIVKKIREKQAISTGGASMIGGGLSLSGGLAIIDQDTAVSIL
jgi:hypothetical protein